MGLNALIIDDIYDRELRVYENFCPTIRAERQGLKVLFLIDTQGRTEKKVNPIIDILPTLRAQTHGNVPMVVLGLKTL